MCPSTYTPDTVETVRIVKGDAEALQGMCADGHLLPLTSLNTCNNHYKKQINYQQGQSRVSELASCILSSKPAQLHIQLCNVPEHHIAI
ncbi:hypothetical protein E2C01_070499 [Portunus trituberculatus]|uniref:Uncharacterized protein n=1 Tax=Portunus trituberculatus TaxID=210409 RepID=A0A5B7I1R8_PORTR|nr:hypothetical protein [Portunus trituberculatus]